MQGFEADPTEIAAAAKAFNAEVDPVDTARKNAQHISGSTGTVGAYYAAQGNDYHAAVSAMLTTLFDPMATHTIRIAAALRATADDYHTSDASAESELSSAAKKL